MKRKPQKEITTLTPAQRRALTILAAEGPMGPSTFGHKMWPKHATLNRELRAQGAGYAGGTYLSKLQRLGLVEYEHGARRYRITRKGNALVRGERYVPPDHYTNPGAA